MKLPTLPKFSLAKLSRPKPAARPKRLQATARRAAQPMMDDYDDEPTTRLSSAFIVVFILHVVAVGGIYAFNSIKSQRRSKELTSEVVPSAAVADSVIKTSVTAESGRTDTVSATAPTPPSVPSNLVSPVSGGRVHKVKSGETLSHLAALYSMSVSDIAKANGLESDAKLKLGQALNIPSGRQSVAKTESSDTRKAAASSSPAPSKTKSSSGAKTYTVVKGDNPVTIAKRFGVSYDDLLKLNKISDPRRLQLGQELKIPAKKN